MGRMIVNIVHTFWASFGLMFWCSCFSYALIARKVGLYSRISTWQHFKHLCRGWLICALVYTLLSIAIPSISVIGYVQTNRGGLGSLEYVLMFSLACIIGYIINKRIVNALCREAIRLKSVEGDVIYRSSVRGLRMKKLLLSPMQVRLVVCSCVSLVLVAAYFASAFLFIVLVPWHKARTNYEKWISGEKQRCERLYYDQVIQVSSSKDPGVRLSSQNPDEYTKLLNPDEYAKMLRQTAVTGVVPKLAKDFQPEVKQPADKAVIATEEDKRENKLLIEATGRAAAAGDSTLEDEARQLGFKIGDSPEIIKSNVVEFRRRTDILDSERKGREFATPMVGWLDWRRKLADWDGSCPVSYEAYTPSVKRDPFDDLIDNQIAIRQGAVFNDAGTLSST